MFANRKPKELNIFSKWERQTKVVKILTLKRKEKKLCDADTGMHCSKSENQKCKNKVQIDKRTPSPILESLRTKVHPKHS